MDLRIFTYEELEEKRENLLDELDYYPDGTQRHDDIYDVLEEVYQELKKRDAEYKNLKEKFGNMGWQYGLMLLEEDDLTESEIAMWNSEVEYVLSTMDDKFDYLWKVEFDEGGNVDKIVFTDRLYDSYMYSHDKSFLDEQLKNRTKNKTDVMSFNSFKQVKKWIDENKEVVK